MSAIDGFMFSTHWYTRIHKITVQWDVTPCSLVNGHQHCFEMLVPIHQAKRQHIADNRYENPRKESFQTDTFLYDYRL
jgi:hypothetical protein